MDPNKFRQEFLNQVAFPAADESLFDHLAMLTYFIKDHSGRYVCVNRTLVERCGESDKLALIGRTADEVYPAPFGGYFLEQDLELIKTGQPLLNEIEQHPYPKRETGWCITTKLPLRNRDQQIIGLVGMSRDLQSPDESPETYDCVMKVIKQVKSNLESSFTTSELADFAGVSVWQLDQRIRDVFGVTTAQLILQFRMDVAAKILRGSIEPIVSVALKIGYGDQSAFTRQFRKTFGTTPGEYRRNSGAVL